MSGYFHFEKVYNSLIVELLMNVICLFVWHRYCTNHDNNNNNITVNAYISSCDE